MFATHEGEERGQTQILINPSNISGSDHPYDRPGVRRQVWSVVTLRVPGESHREDPYRQKRWGRTSMYFCVLKNTMKSRQRISDGKQEGRMYQIRRGKSFDPGRRRELCWCLEFGGRTRMQSLFFLLSERERTQVS